jgi:hypothetical protein
MNSKENLIQSIQRSNLSTKDKEALIDILQEEKLDKFKLAKTFLKIVEVGGQILKLFDQFNNT